MGHGNYAKISSVPMGKEIKRETSKTLHHLWFSIELNPLLNVRSAKVLFSTKETRRNDKILPVCVIKFIFNAVVQLIASHF